MYDVDANRIAVVGGGIVGVSVALTLQLAGHRTLLIEKGEPGRGCSYGNAGVIATSFVLPLSSPRHILAAPRMLLDPLGPLAIRFSHLPALAPWLGRFLLNAMPARQQRTMDGLKSLNAFALPAWRELLDRIGMRQLLIERGMLEVTRSMLGMTRLRTSTARLRAAGIAVIELGEAEIGEMEPALCGRVAGGVIHEDVAHVEDPFGLTQALLAHFIAIGGQLRRDTVRAIAPVNDGARLDCVAGRVDAAQVIITAGFESARLLARLGVVAPIGVEHGYHLMLPYPGAMPTRPVSFHPESFLATPMSEGLRLAGTIELAKVDATPNWSRADRLFELALSYLPQLNSEAATRWMGARPSFPDSLPVIGNLKNAPQISYAFGHQHLGLTLAAITAKCVHALVAGDSLPLPLDSFSLERFGSIRRQQGIPQLIGGFL